MTNKEEKATPDTSETKPVAHDLTYEEAIKQLEAIVAKLESGEISLDESMKLFQQGTELSRICSLKLDAIEQQISKLIEKTDGTVVEEPFDAEN